MFRTLILSLKHRARCRGDAAAICEKKSRPASKILAVYLWRPWIQNSWKQNGWYQRGITRQPSRSPSFTVKVLQLSLHRSLVRDRDLWMHLLVFQRVDAGHQCRGWKHTAFHKIPNLMLIAKPPTVQFHVKFPVVKTANLVATWSCPLPQRC